MEWISAAEGQKFAKVMREIEEMRSQVTPEETKKSIEVATKKLEAIAARRQKARAKAAQKKGAVAKGQPS
jgi:ABC-type Fe3+ transport system substrate-binding protein